MFIFYKMCQSTLYFGKYTWLNEIQFIYKKINQGDQKDFRIFHFISSTSR